MSVPLGEFTGVFGRIAALSFGGPAAQIAVMHRILVEEKRWLGDGRFLHALNFCMLLPGPEAMQLATYVGWLLRGVSGALIAGLLFILPGVLAIMALSVAYVLWGGLPWIDGALFGVKAAVLAIVVQAVIRVGRRALRNGWMRGIAAASFAAIFLLGVPFPAIVLGAAVLGWVGGRIGHPAFRGGGGHGGAGAHVPDAGTLLDRTPAPPARPAQIAGIAAVALWLGPVAALALAAPTSVFSGIALFFSKLAVLTFGGAYAVLAWVAQEAVTSRGWLTAGQMLDGLGMAETTPGPLIMVLQFVGFLAAWPQGLAAAVLGGLLATWVTFAPCFAWILLGAPHVERLRGNKALSAALAAVTAAVVGVILNLAVWFGLHVLFREVSPGPPAMPAPESLNLAALSLATLAALAVFWRGWGMGRVLAGAAAAGMALRLLGLA